MLQSIIFDKLDFVSDLTHHLNEDGVMYLHNIIIDKLIKQINLQSYNYLCVLTQQVNIIFIYTSFSYVYYINNNMYYQFFFLLFPGYES